MVEKFYPKNICECGSVTWNYNVNTLSVRCCCGNMIKKKLHGIIGAELSKDDKGNYVLEFPELKEKDTFSSWSLLREELDRLAKNEEDNEY